MEQRLSILSESKSKLVDAWRTSIITQGNRIIMSDLFRLYAAEVDLVDKDISFLLDNSDTTDAEKGTSHLSAQLPLMQDTLREFVAHTDFLTAKIVNRKGQTYIASDSTFIPLTEPQKKVSSKCISTGKPAYSSLRQSPQGLTMDIALPILGPQTSDDKARPVSSLLLTHTVGQTLSRFLAPSPLTGTGYKTHILQISEGSFQELMPWLPEGMRSVDSLPLSEEQLTLPFDLRSSFSGMGNAYSLGTWIPEPGWMLIEEVDLAVAQKQLKAFKRSALTMIGLIFLLLGAAYLAIWWRFSYVESKRIGLKFQELNLELEKQRSLLTGITESAEDFIALKDTFGHYKYVNNAMSTALNRSPEEILGMDDVALFGYDTGNRLEEGDQQTYASMTPTRFVEKIYLKSTPHTFQIIKIPYRPAKQPEGIVSIYRDISDLVQAQKQQERATRKTVEALVKTIETSDPYLAGHSRLVGRFALEVGKELGLNEEEKATLEMAANLSQIGKQFIPKDILHKSGKLTPEERKIMEQHVVHAQRILCSVDFKIPILKTVMQMNEHIDGSGYPNGLKGDAIPTPARILSVANAFCAMVRPRSYRPAMQAEVALAKMKELGNIYDQDVVRALEKALGTRSGQELLIEENGSKTCDI